jgi:hypothetical protein
LRSGHTTTDLGTAWVVAVLCGRREEASEDTGGDARVTIRCLLDGLLLYATLCPEPAALLAFDGDESFVMEAVEAIYYELVSATHDELLGLERACYRLLRRAADFRHVGDGGATPVA